MRAFGIRDLFSRLCADRAWSALGVLDVKHGLVSLDKGLECLALIVLDTLLVDLEVNDVDNVGYDLARILKPNAHAVSARLVRQELDEINRICLGQAKPVLVGLEGTD